MKIVKERMLYRDAVLRCHRITALPHNCLPRLPAISCNYTTQLYPAVIMIAAYCTPLVPLAALPALQLQVLPVINFSPASHQIHQRFSRCEWDLLVHQHEPIWSVQCYLVVVVTLKTNVSHFPNPPRRSPVGSEPAKAAFGLL